MAQATQRYSLEGQAWFRAGDVDGDGGDSAFMNENPRRWTADPGCDMHGLPGVTHMDILTDDDALDLFVRAASRGDSAVPCVSP